jgi:hypothetical protein
VQSRCNLALIRAQKAVGGKLALDKCLSDHKALAEGFASGARGVANAAAPRGGTAFLSAEELGEAIARNDDWNRRYTEAIMLTDPDDECYEFMMTVRDAISKPLPTADIPPCYHAPYSLPSFLNGELRMLPYSTRVRPPTTSARPPLECQRPLDPGVPMPNHCRGLWDPGVFDAKYDPWMRRMGLWLNGTSLHPPDPLVMGMEGMQKCYLGKWFTFKDGVGALTDFTHKVVSHLMVDYMLQFAPGYPDQGIFSVLEYGVDFQTTGLQPTLVLQAHSNSMLAVQGKIMTGLERRAKLGWYEEHDAVPFYPWRTSRIQARARPSDPDRSRQLVNASAPLFNPANPLVDSVGVRVVSLNEAAKRDPDVHRGTTEATFKPWDERLQSTRLSPPPSPSQEHDSATDAPHTAGPKLNQSAMPSVAVVGPAR